MPDFQRLARLHLERTLAVAVSSGDDEWAVLLRGELEQYLATGSTVTDGAAEQREDGVYAVGGGWHEVLINGEVIEKIRGADAAQEAYEAYRQSEPDEE